MTSCNPHNSARRKQLRVNLWKPRHLPSSLIKAEPQACTLPSPVTMLCTLQDTALDTALPTRGTSPCSTHQAESTGLATRRLPQASGPLGEDATSKRNYDPAASIKESINRQNEMAEKCFGWRNKIKTHKKQLNEETATKKKKKEFRVMMVKMVQDLGKRMRHRLRTYKRCLTKSYKM